MVRAATLHLQSKFEKNNGCVLVKQGWVYHPGVIKNRHL